MFVPATVVDFLCAWNAVREREREMDIRVLVAVKQNESVLSRLIPLVFGSASVEGSLRF